MSKKSDRLKAFNAKMRKAGYVARWMPMSGYIKDKKKRRDAVKALNANNPMREYRVGANYNKTAWTIERKEWY
jgi:hypothetical protein